MKFDFKQKYVGPGIMVIHIIGQIVLGLLNVIQPFEFFNLLLLIVNLILAIALYKGQADPFICIGIMLIIMAHIIIGQRVAPDSLTNGALLVVNILIFYVGVKLYQELPFEHLIVFIASYLILFFIFIINMSNAEALFLLALMGLAATIRNFKLIAYFWALVAAFTFFQPYNWEAIIILYFSLKIIFSARDRSTSKLGLVFLGVGLVLIFLVLLPVLVLILKEDPRNIVNVMGQEAVLNAIWNTLKTATVATLILVIFCVPLAYAIARIDFFGKHFLLSIIDLPIIIPQSAAGIAILQVFGKNQFLGEALFNLIGIRFDGTTLGIILAQIFVAVPFIMKSTLSAFEAVPPELEQGARSLGATPLAAFCRIALPLASRGIFAGAVLAWARAAGEFAAVLIIASYPETVPVFVYNKFTSVGLVEVAPFVSTVLLFSVAMFFLLQLVTKVMPELHKKEYSL